VTTLQVRGTTPPVPTRPGALCSVHVTKYYSPDYIKKSAIGTACSTYGGEERCIQCFGGKT
jgi:hypothetical protein